MSRMRRASVMVWLLNEKAFIKNTLRFETSPFRGIEMHLGEG
jgi:hypothetical protein